ncbi:S26 family signal peptidase [Kitasatospora sp. NPDC092039]|uniref:S26 family signal peptidase n=1 Tax=Kitasatospora sp. NPDC092039 TaxID=3364086 RepID=UPI00382E15E1
MKLPWIAAVPAVVTALVAVRLVRLALVVVTVRGESMLPALRDGDRVLVLRASGPAVGQVVVIEHADAHGRWPDGPLRRLRPVGAGGGPAGRRWAIKRVAALPGDPVPAVARSGPAGDGPVPPGALVLLGDNPAASVDSRQAGCFPLDRVLGRVLRRLPASRAAGRGGGAAAPAHRQLQGHRG